MNKKKLLTNSLAVFAFASALSSPVEAAPVLVNGGFEAGFTGWVTADSLGSDGTFTLQNGTTSPINFDPVPAPPGGVSAVMSDGGGPGTHVLWQDFLVTSGGPQVMLSFDLFTGNRAQVFGTPNPANLDFGINAANQQVRVDLLMGSADPFSVAAGDVLLNLYQSQPGDALVAGYTTYSFDISSVLNANLGNTLRIRFAETDNLAALQAGVDNVGITEVTEAVPEPATVAMVGIGFALLAGTLRRRRA